LPRLFTGLEIPPEVALALSLKRGGLYGARWMDPDNYHITLRFIGDVDHQTANEVTDALDRLANTTDPREVRAWALGPRTLPLAGETGARSVHEGVEPSSWVPGRQRIDARISTRRSTGVTGLR